MIRSFRKRSERPSHKELSGKLRTAKELVRSGHWLPANPAKLREDFEALERLGLDMALQEDQAAMLMGVLSEIKPEDYIGGHPPDPSRDPAAPGLDLFPFEWRSSCCVNREMYCKFSIVRIDENEQRLVMFSLHPSRP